MFLFLLIGLITFQLYRRHPDPTPLSPHPFKRSIHFTYATNFTTSFGGSSQRFLSSSAISHLLSKGNRAYSE
jgi:hypothetical protein